MIRSLLTICVVGVLLWLAATVPIGRFTLVEHARRIWATEPARELERSARREADAAARAAARAAAERATRALARDGGAAR